MMKTQEIELIQIQFHNSHNEKIKCIYSQAKGHQKIPTRKQQKKKEQQKQREKYWQKLKQKDKKQGNQLYNKFSSYINKQKKKYLEQKLQQYYGKNFPINYREEYQFDEQWKNKFFQFQNRQENIKYFQTNLQVTISAITMLNFNVIIWANTLAHFIDVGKSQIDGNGIIYAIGFILQIINAYMKVSNMKLYKLELKDKLKKIIKKIILQLITLPYFLINIFISDANHLTFVWIGYSWIVWIILYKEASKRYHSLRLTSFCLHHQYQTKLLDMLATIFIVAHFIALILYSATRSDPENSWLTNLQIDKTDAFTIYTYAFYFTVTTIMTVGYGDITPKNRVQIIIVCLVEIFGIIMFGYMINQIGYCISSLRKNQEVIDRDLFVVEKLKHHYKMGDELTAKVRGYLLDSKPKLDQVSPEEQQGILMKLNEEIREDLSRQNMASVVRSSIFFICRWSRNFQDSVSRNLTHIMAKPNDVLYQPLGKERLYIIRSGKVHLYAQRTGSKMGLRNPLKTIQTDTKKSISDNCYGYSAVISIRPVQLYAISKDFSSCYYIQKSAFLQSVKEKACDFQTYHQIKSKINQAKLCETFQAPRLQSSKHHYNPTVSLLIKKYIAKNEDKASRKPYIRFDRNLFRGVKTIYFNRQANSQTSQPDQQSVQTQKQITLLSAIPQKTTKQILNIQYARSVSKSISIDVKQNLHHFFQSSKFYLNYFKDHNLKNVLHKYDNSFYHPRNQQKLRAQLRMQMQRQLNLSKRA